MAQLYTKINSHDSLSDAPAALNDNFGTVLTSNSGESAPLSPEEGNLWLKVGTPSALYVYKNGAWSVVVDADDTSIKQNQNSRLDAIANAIIMLPTGHIPVYSSDSAVTFREAGASGLSILQSASNAGATFVNSAETNATEDAKGIVSFADTSNALSLDGNIDPDSVVTVGHLNRRTFESLLFILEANEMQQKTHNLGDTPRWVRLVAVCTDDSYGHIAGDEIEIKILGSNGSTMYFANSNNVNCRIGSSLIIPTINGGRDLLSAQAASDGDNVKWKLKIYAGL